MGKVKVLVTYTVIISQTHSSCICSSHADHMPTTPSRPEDRITYTNKRSEDVGDKDELKEEIGNSEQVKGVLQHPVHWVRGSEHH